MGLYLKVILRDVDMNDNVKLVRGDNFLKENPVFLSQKLKPRLRRRWSNLGCVFIPPTCNVAALELSGAFVKGLGVKLGRGKYLV